MFRRRPGGRETSNNKDGENEEGGGCTQWRRDKILNAADGDEKKQLTWTKTGIYTLPSILLLFLKLLRHTHTQTRTYTHTGRDAAGGEGEGEWAGFE